MLHFFIPRSFAQFCPCERIITLGLVADERLQFIDPVEPTISLDIITIPNIIVQSTNTEIPIGTS